MRYLALLLAAILCCALPCSSVAQAVAPADSAALANELNKGAWGVHLMPLSLFEFYPRLRAGAIWQKGRMAYLLDLEYAKGGVPPPQWSWAEANRQSEYVFYGIRPELRFYPAPRGYLKNRQRGAYVAVEANLSYLELTLDKPGEYQSRWDYYRYDSGLMKRVRVTGLFKVGHFDRLSDRLYLDGYLGVGMGNRNTAYLNVVNERRLDEDEITLEWGFLPTFSRAGNVFILDFALGLRVGYLL